MKDNLENISLETIAELQKIADMQREIAELQEILDRYKEKLETKCEFDYCVYNEDYYCLLENVDVSGAGMCMEFTLVSISFEDLKKLKRKHRKKL